MTWPKRTTMIAVLAAGLPFAFVSFCCANCLWMPTIPPHRGDGQFENVSRRYYFAAVPGYTISMPKFDLGKDFKGEYKVTGMANVGEGILYMGMRYAPFEIWTKDREFEGWLDLEMVDKHGNALVNVSGKLGDYVWFGTGNLNALYQYPQSGFRPNINEEYRIRISYRPDPRLAGLKGFVYIEVGGRI